LLDVLPFHSHVFLSAQLSSFGIPRLCQKEERLLQKIQEREAVQEVPG
jgi:hypothetical protein